MNRSKERSDICQAPLEIIVNNESFCCFFEWDIENKLPICQAPNYTRSCPDFTEEGIWF